MNDWRPENPTLPSTAPTSDPFTSATYHSAGAALLTRERQTSQAPVLADTGRMTRFSPAPLRAMQFLPTTGVIPHWVCSQSDFPIGYETYVIVSVAGGIDPNPTITVQTQPQNQVALLGTTALFEIDASPADYLSYQWLFDGKPMPGENDSILIIDVEKTTQSGNYSVLMNTGGKNVASKVASLKVILPVEITAEPKSQAVKAGHGAVFRVAVKGTSPYKYQWYFNNGLIPKATGPSYVIGKAEDSNAGTYSVIVKNQLSSATATVTLTVNP